MRIRHFLHPEAKLLHDVIAAEYWPRSVVPTGLGPISRLLRAREEGAKFSAFLFQVARGAGVIAPERADFPGWLPHTVLLASDDPTLRRLAWQEIDRAERARAASCGPHDSARPEPWRYRRMLRA